MQAPKFVRHLKHLLSLQVIKLRKINHCSVLYLFSFCLTCCISCHLHRDSGKKNSPQSTVPHVPATTSTTTELLMARLDLSQALFLRAFFAAFIYYCWPSCSQKCDQIYRALAPDDGT